MRIDEYMIGVDIGGTNIRIGAVDSLYNLHSPIKTPTTPFCGSNAAAKLIGFIQDYIKNLDAPVKAVTLGFPSTINKERSTILSTPNIEGMCNINVKDSFSKALNLPVFIEKDACMLVYYDLLKNNIATDGIITGFYFGTGLGNVILINGVPLVGKNGVACELGHVPTLSGTEKCGCGLNGCLEIYAAGRALERLCAQSFQKIDISIIFTEYGETAEIDGFIQAIAKAVATEVNILNPDIIVLGGGIIAMKNFPINKLTNYIKEFTRKPLPSEDLNFIISDMSSPFNGVIGAVAYTRKNLLQTI